MNRLALVTGSSAGIGLELAKELASRGHDIIGVGSSARIEGLRDQLPSVTVVQVQADLGTAAGVETVWQRVVELGRPLDVAALNAGKSRGGSPWLPA
ncbi:SDR family NAD(P)-dependent oxidoreductase [Arsenicicoccus cauae]|uniref:SDR family NAD(P)-dependent oxidoreductase n=1 Tax=Arsenicicoccus cauae TaxID=2663847 RepID=UPI00370DAF57